MYEKFGKSFRDIADLKKDFFDQNERLLQRTLEFAQLYTAQPRRNQCKICSFQLPAEASFRKHCVPYSLCSRCGHLNGMHDDTDEFCMAVYTDAGGKRYAENYGSSDAKAYEARRDAIYVPKADFLIDVLRRLGETPERMSYADMGAGAGYFIAAMIKCGIQNITGYEVGQAQVDLGQWMLGSANLNLIKLNDIVSLTHSEPVDVVTFIGVFEHLQNPRSVLRSIKLNQNVKYLYFCVPLFSPTVYNEMVFPGIMPRQLAIGHTHLFSRSSIDYIASEFDLTPVGAWWFGTDMMDYFRSVYVSICNDPNLVSMADNFRDAFAPLIDDLQVAIDKRRQSSQVHMVFMVR